MSTTSGRKLRLNVVALISDATVGRLLVCVDDGAIMEDLSSKVRGALAKSAIEGHLLRLTNSCGANLPSDEKVGDVLRDAEEVVAVLTATPEDPGRRQQLAGGVGEIMSFARAAPQQADDRPRGQQSAIAANVGGGPRLQQRPPGETLGAMEDSFSTALPPSPRGQQRAPAQPSTQIPGPAETFEEDLQEMPNNAVLGADMRSRLPSRTDWTVEGLSPKLREYISTRFGEANAASADVGVGNSFIAVTMRPRARAGAVPSQPIHYSIARIDVVEFERLCALKIQETRTRADHFRRCEEALKSLCDRGSAVTEYAPNLLPYRFRDEEDHSGLLAEAESSSFGQVEGFRPTIVIDNSCALGENLAFIRSALKRILYSFLVAKSKFNLLKFSPQGNPIAWANGMVPPTAQVLREAEEFLDSIRPVRGNHSASLMEGVQMALAHPEADVVYVLTSGLPKRCSLEAATRSLRSMNIRDLPLHIVGVECEPKAELDLRRLAEDNHGSFRNKRFSFSSQGSFSSSAGSSGSQASADARNDVDTHLTISGQLSILEVMLDEQERHTVDWLEEQKCANRLLLTTASQQAVPDADAMRAHFQRAALAEGMKQMGQGPSRLQELVEAHTARLASPCSQGAGAGYERRRVAEADRRSASLPRGTGAAAVEAMRRPSVVNPWDRPGAVIKASTLTGKNARGPGLPPPRPGGARSRPSSASRRPASASRQNF